jgi:hypothetical protein
VLIGHLETFLTRTRERDNGRGLPQFVVRGLRRYLACGRFRCAMTMRPASR